MTNERLKELQNLSEEIEHLEETITQFDDPYDRYQIIGRNTGWALSDADVLCELDGGMLSIVVDYLKNKLNRLKDEFEEA